MGDANSTNAEILTRFVATFKKLDDLVIRDHACVIPPELRDGLDDSPWAFPRWKPVAIASPRQMLDQLYSCLPIRFPPLYEELLLSYRWLDVELGGFVHLYANPPDHDFSALLSQIMRDPGIATPLLAHGLIPFGTAGDDHYDAICFDMRHVPKDGDCPVVRVEHESLLCHDELGLRWRIADSFRDLMEAVIVRARQIS